MSRKEFIESQGATCDNWRNAWSFINKKDKIIIFGMWIENDSMILRQQSKGRNLPAYTQAIRHIRLIEEEGYTLQTFLQKNRRSKHEPGPSGIGSINPKLTIKKLIKRKDANGVIEWFAIDGEFSLAEEVDESDGYYEGATKKILVNVYERNAEARKKCIEFHHCQCVVCNFDFEKIYGSIGKEYIHVHHVIPLAEIKQEYEVDPIKDLIPVCPNCHAMIHKAQPALTVKQLKKRIN